MIVFVNGQFTPQLLEPDNFRKFSIEIELPKDRFDDLKTALRDVVCFESDTSAWVSSSVLQEMSPAGGSPSWRAEFARMIEKARPHGWIRDTPKLAIKAHVVWGG
jgi:hypothetical protein